MFFAEYIFAAVLGLYKDEKAQDLPSSDEVLICSLDTTSEEVLKRRTFHKYTIGTNIRYVKIGQSELSFFILFP